MNNENQSQQEAVTEVVIEVSVPKRGPGRPRKYASAEESRAAQAACMRRLRNEREEKETEKLKEKYAGLVESYNQLILAETPKRAS